MLVYLLTLLSIASPHILNTLLKSYKTLHKNELTIKFFPQNVILSLNIENQSYVATLSPNKQLFHKHFSVDVLRFNGTTTLNNPTDGHFIGTLDATSNSHVAVHIEDGVVTGSIEIYNELYYIEPSWRHIPEPHNFHMILYKKSDLLYNFGNPETGEFCGHKDSHDHDHDPHNFVLPKSTSQATGPSLQYETRFKRASDQQDTCEVILIADYKFYVDIGGSSEIITKSYLIAIFERINRIFQSTEFQTSDQSFAGYGMQIKKVLIHTTPSSDPTHYNYNTNWGVSDMLDAFGYGDSENFWSEYCLAHLYTNRDFDAGVLGLAYVASPISNKVGGVCSSPYISGNNNRKRMLNIGLSTSVNYGRTLLSSELELVSAHEIGHNWGSSHDPDNLDECAPRGNYFIMYPSAVDGTRSNNKLFSPCSRSAIASVLKYKSSCFVVPSVTICGNGIVEEEEEDCDPGAEKTDPCCNEECKFVGGAVCSDLNSECCSDCQYAGSAHVCYQSSSSHDIINACIATKNCSADSAVCDDITYKTDGSACFDEGMCLERECKDFCAAKGLTLCQGQGNASCYWMCTDTDGACTRQYTKLPDGKPCQNGFCEDGICVLEPQTQTKLWTIFTSLTPSLFLKWMRNNVVLVVILFTSIFWIPLSIFVNWLDQGQDEVDYHFHTLQRKKEVLKAQMSTVSSKSFELKTVIQEPSHTFSLTGQNF